MAENSKIEWTDYTWNPITGCSVVSPGCTNCYAMRLAGTRLKHHPSRKGLTQPSKAGPVWTGEVRLNEQWLDQPIRWKRPRKIFVCAHGDLFHENVPEEWIDKAYARMALARHHIYQVLTKRPERAHGYLTRDGVDHAGKPMDSPGMGTRDGIRRVMVDTGLYDGLDDWPLPNVWLGVSVENAAHMERIDDLRRTPAAVRFLSLEPLLGPLPALNLEGIHWVIVGGESGPGARPMHPDWARDLRDQCQAAGVPFFMKQMARKAPIPDDLMVREFPSVNRTTETEKENTNE